MAKRADENPGQKLCVEKMRRFSFCTLGKRAAVLAVVRVVADLLHELHVVLAALLPLGARVLALLPLQALEHLLVLLGDFLQLAHLGALLALLDLAAEARVALVRVAPREPEPR